MCKNYLTAWKELINEIYHKSGLPRSGGKNLENDTFSRSGKSQRISFSVRNLEKMKKVGEFQNFPKSCKLPGFWKFYFP